MKTLNKIKTIGLSLLLTGAMLTGCKKGDVSDVSGASTPQGYNRPIRTLNGPSLTIKVIDTAPNRAYKEVNVEIRRIDVLYQKTDPIGWHTVTETPKMIDLMNLKNGLLLDKTKLFIGKIEKIRLFFGAQNSIVSLTNGERSWFELKIPSNYQSGVEIPVGVEMKDNADGLVVLDFEVNNSVSNEGNGVYILNPVIKSRSINTSEAPPFVLNN